MSVERMSWTMTLLVPWVGLIRIGLVDGRTQTDAMAGIGCAPPSSILPRPFPILHWRPLLCSTRLPSDL